MTLLKLWRYWQMNLENNWSVAMAVWSQERTTYDISRFRRLLYNDSSVHVQMLWMTPLWNIFRLYAYYTKKKVKDSLLKYNRSPLISVVVPVIIKIRMVFPRNDVTIQVQWSETCCMAFLLYHDSLIECLLGFDRIGYNCRT
jgi:hypothetical protein